ncbi:MAG: glycosyltransferase family 4 protein [Sphingobium sp.]
MHESADRPGRPPASRRRVCFVIEALGPGGAERVISLLASRWVEAGWDVAICSFDCPDDRVYHALDRRVRLLRIGEGDAGRGRLTRMTSLFRRIVRLRSLLRQEQPDAVLGFLTKINALTLAAAMGTKLKVAVSERNNPAQQRAHPLWNLLMKVLFRRADAIIVQTRRVAEHVPPSARGRVRVIPNPIEAPVGRPAPYDADGPLQCVAVGRLTEQKGFDLLIDAFARVAPGNPRWSLSIWGEGPERAALDERIAASDMTGRILLRGVSATQGAWAEGASAFVLSSRYEGFPNALGEAMACGLPVIAFDCPYGPREMIQTGHDGLLVANGHVVALARALDHVMKDAAMRRALGENAALSARRFRLDEIARQWEAAVGALADPSPLPRRPAAKAVAR